jgi:hypothetical protein
MYMKSRSLNSQSTHRGHLLKRMGLAGFAFFFFKGLLWLLVPWLAHSAIF